MHVPDSPNRLLVTQPLQSARNVANQTLGGTSRARPRRSRTARSTRRPGRRRSGKWSRCRRSCRKTSSRSSALKWSCAVFCQSFRSTSRGELPRSNAGTLRDLLRAARCNIARARARLARTLVSTQSRQRAKRCRRELSETVRSNSACRRATSKPPWSAFSQ